MENIDRGVCEETVVRIWVRGRVQGVGYRAFVQTEAIARGVIGWVRNRRNGDVEAVFAGPLTAVEALCAICRRGPPHAVVAALDIVPADISALADADGTADSFVVRKDWRSSGFMDRF